MCNNIIEKQYKTEEEFLANYDANKYEKPSVTVDMLIFTINKTKSENYRALSNKSLQILMVKRKDYPYKDKWAIPGGFAKIDENIKDSALRELKEETNLDNVYMEQLYTWGDVGRDPRTRVVSVSYMALANKEELDVKAGDDAAEANWFDVSYTLDNVTNEDGIEKKDYILQLKNDEVTLQATIRENKTINHNIIDIKYEIINNGDIAFDHAKIIAYALYRLKTKVEWSDIAFHLMPDEFTIGDLQDTYSLILGKELIAPNFRRKMKPMLIDIGKESEDIAGHRPAKLFKFNPNWKEEGGIF
ncbi:NUDIX hydrolase [Thomasclavelia cocleata]|uniref:NUDIX hydrolase n=1 Tax=Thomasclavelia cocleata TaxID=69824 RepID=UPI00256EF652|nr:NUDIX hydrolase [Thomasclavelia cocleata]